MKKQQLKTFKSLEIAFTTFVFENGDIGIIKRDELGRQSCQRYDVDRVFKKNKGRVKVYYHYKKKIYSQYLDWSELFKSAYPNTPVPPAMQSYCSEPQHHHKPNPMLNEQLALF